MRPSSRAVGGNLRQGQGDILKRVPITRRQRRPARSPANIEENIKPGFSLEGRPVGKKPSLKLVKPSPVTGPAPSRTLGVHGRSLWDRVMTEYDIQDSGGLEMLLQACGALDRAEALRIEIERDGLLPCP